ncbi:carbohydrate ABC transporter permease [Palleronia abyssalis]|uniref:Lactose transport system permease protein LacF n=1 Tax=Palleronia abyssalis TaxID=1501240 RepID=A0A2R8C1V5_9RHOB|nr:sugar ABC transporter permease [Palleronia abyssalis]SPJ26405.1 Lactose transport system permease protein LacF [Palleronia abyssalis]
MSRSVDERGPGAPRLAPWLFLSPLIVFAAIFLILPLGFSLYLTFTRWNPLGAPRWVGLRQFEYLFTRDAAFWDTLQNTFVVAGGLIFIGMPLSLMLAAIFARSRGRTVWRSIFYLPQVTNIVAIAYIWQFLLDDRYGLVNRGLGLIGLAGPDWLTDGTWAMVSVVVVMIWYELGKNMLVFLAAIDGLDPQIYEAAVLDGASGPRIFRSITVPMIRPAMIFVTVTSFITGMGWFALILAMTGGGPRGATDVTALYMYDMAFQDLRMGRASAAAMILFAIIAVIAVVQFRLLRERAT